MSMPASRPSARTASRTVCGDGIRTPSGREAHSADDGSPGVDGDGIRLRAADIQSDLHRPTSLREAAWLHREHQPLTAPATRPPVMRPWTIRKKMTTGIEISVEPAMTAPQLVASVADWNELSHVGSVRL